MNRIALAMSAKRGSGFWIAGCTALFLSFVSWLKPVAVGFFNLHVFHAGRFDDPGWWFYLALLFPVAGFLLWTVFRFPLSEGRSDNGAEGISNTRFFDPLMGLRALACVIVLLGHYFLVLFSLYPNGAYRYLRMLLLAPPWAGVWLFFTLSGYLMGKGFARGRYTLDEAGSRLFLRNRMLRIVPVYYCGVLLVSVYRYTDIFHWKHLWMLLEIGLFDYRGDLPISPISPLWSVSTEVQFYLLVPLLMVGLLHLRRWSGKAFVLMPFLLIGAGTAGRLWLARGRLNIWTYGYTPMIPNLDMFIAGMSINLLPKMKNVPVVVREHLGRILFVGAVGFYGLICYISNTLGRFHMRLEDFIARGPALCALFAIGFIYLAETRGRFVIRPGFTGRFQVLVQAIGTLTYCLYVFHHDVFAANGATLPNAHSFRLSLLNFPMVMLQTVAVAGFFYLAVEKPFDLKKRVSGTALVDAP